MSPLRAWRFRPMEAGLLLIEICDRVRIDVAAAQNADFNFDTHYGSAW